MQSQAEFQTKHHCKSKSISEKHPKIKQKIVKYNTVEEETEGSRAKLKNQEIASENTIYISQLQELARYFSSIENSGIRQYGINLMKDIAKYESKEKARIRLSFTATVNIFMGVAFPMRNL